MLAVTTRNKLHHWRFCLPMLQARRHVREQLATTPGLIRYVSAVASPTEFMTMTVWENRQAMFNFMSSGAHETIMWMFTRWSASFWSMRWIPTSAEQGAWEGLSLANLDELGNQLSRDVRPQAPQLPLPEQRQRPGKALDRRSSDPSGSGVFAITALVEAASPGHLWTLLSAAREFRRATSDSQLLRWSIGTVAPRLFWVLMLWQDVSAGAADAVYVLRQRLGASWTMSWAAGEYEIGHWNGLRLRQLAAARNRESRVNPETNEHTGSELE